MAVVTSITENQLNEIVTLHGFNPELLQKDYYIILVLYLIKEVLGIYFKGGTALNTIFLHHARLSEDIDFTITRNPKEVQAEIVLILQESHIFTTITEDKNLPEFVRIVLFYRTFSGKEDKIFIDLNKRATMLLEPEEHIIEHFYQENIPSFSIKTLAVEEMIAEKLKATMTRNKPRDHFDIYTIIQAKLPLNLELAERKCKEAGKEFSIVRMFKNAQKLKTQWEPDLIPLLTEEVPFHTVIKTLATHFKLREEKEKVKKEKQRGKFEHGTETKT